jgi:pimeloyl-ACP methyl ester carboxylesterase
MLLKAAGAVTHAVQRLHGGRVERREIAGASVPVWTFGPEGGEPWLLLHGLASSSLAWRPVVQALKPECRLVAPELSSWAGARQVKGQGGLTLDQMVAVARELVDEDLGGGPVTVAGMSLGGWASVLYALEESQRVGRLLLVDAAGYREQDWERVERLVRVRTRSDLDELVTELFARVPPGFRFAREGFYRAYRSPGVQSTLDTMEESHAYGDEELARLPMPVGLVWGREDGLFGPEVAEATARRLPTSRLWLLDECGHDPHWEAVEEFVAAVREFREWAS